MLVVACLIADGPRALVLAIMRTPYYLMLEPTFGPKVHSQSHQGAMNSVEQKQVKQSTDFEAAGNSSQSAPFLSTTYCRNGHASLADHLVLVNRILTIQLPGLLSNHGKASKLTDQPKHRT